MFQPARLALIFLCAFVIGGCSTTKGNLTYVPPTAIIAAGEGQSTHVAVGSFVDQRGETATWIGAIRGGYGNPLKVLEVVPSVSAAVQDAFTAGLQARGFAPTGGKSYQLSGVIRKLDCSQYVRREAHVEIEVNVFDSSTGRQIFGRTYTADSLEGSLVTLKSGIFASEADLRAVAQKTLAQVVDKALDDTAFRSAIRS
ncbi:MAG TPA: hypothetical protein VI653_28595 [Steroidobacteraceae bacterium]